MRHTMTNKMCRCEIFFGIPVNANHTASLSVYVFVSHLVTVHVQCIQTNESEAKYCVLFVCIRQFRSNLYTGINLKHLRLCA